MINLSPQGNRKDTLAITKTGDVLNINGTDYDLSVIPDGATLPNAASATGCALFVSDIQRINGEIHCTLILPFYALPQSQDVLFPQPITVTQDGPVQLPEVNHAD